MTTRMSPTEYAQKYQSLQVYLYTDAQAKAAVGSQLPPGGAWETISLAQYRLGLFPVVKGDKTHAAQYAKDKYLEKLQPYYNAAKVSIPVWVMNATSGQLETRTYVTKSDLLENVVDPFFGKGSPEEVQVTLQLGVRYGAIDRNKVQAYCDEGKIGLDCNGLVGCYLRHVVQELSWYTDAHDADNKMTSFDASAPISGIVTFKDWVAPVTDLTDFTTWSQKPFVMAMADPANGKVVGKYLDDNGEWAFGHIVITEPGTAVMDKPPAGVFGKDTPDTALRVDVWESTSEKGLIPSQYYILPPNKHGVSSVWRGSKKKLMDVTIARLIK